MIYFQTKLPAGRKFTGRPTYFARITKALWYSRVGSSGVSVKYQRCRETGLGGQSIPPLRLSPTPTTKQPVSTPIATLVDHLSFLPATQRDRKLALSYTIVPRTPRNPLTFIFPLPFPRPKRSTSNKQLCERWNKSV